MKQRFYSLDVFRGATVALMILVNNPGNWGQLFAPLKHAEWHGCTPTDLVFPFFLFAVGNALSFVMPRLEAGGTAVFLRKVFIRSLLIFGLGLFLNWAPFVKWSNGELVFKHWVDPNNPNSGIRILGVLQRIALCYFFATLIIYFFKIRGAFVIAVTFLMAYWVICLVANPSDPFSLQGWFGTAIDKRILGEAHMYKGEGIPFDPEGLMSLLPAITQVIFGYLAGNYIQQKSRAGTTNNYEMLSNLFIAGCIFVLTAFCWDYSFPINKKIWTSSYVLYTTGLAIIGLALLIYLIDFKGIKGGWSHFFDVFGKNALFIFLISGLYGRIAELFRWVESISPDGKKVYTTVFRWYYEHVCKLIPNLKLGSLLYAITILGLMWLIAWGLDRKKWYIRV